MKKAQSKIHGIGIFATENIAAGKKFYDVPMDNIHSKPKSGYAKIGKNKFVDDPEILNYMNHSCDPKAELILGDEVCLNALKPISTGDEITCDYNKTEQGGEKMPCNCGSENCRGFFLRN
ncbi:MAG: SET domain-containing protein-lysine N-methyltransferase [Patescibacteria group bacterium]|jgi:SET domain-containing protein